tara:strand:+ start:18169 stop:19410 length:1242 start_codon:yes stop_codon:yes gene_type:complete
MTALASLVSMSNAARAIGPAFEMAGQAIKNTISELWNWFKSTFIDPVLKGIQNIGDTFKAVFDAVTDPIGTLRGKFSEMMGGMIDKTKILDEAVMAAFAKEWDGMLSLKETPEWMTADLWQRLEQESSVMAAQDWDGMLNLKGEKPEWMSNALWEELKTKGTEAAKQEWYTYLDVENLPSWMTNETYEMIKDHAKDLDDFDWEAAFATDTKPWFLTDEEWNNAKEYGQGSVKAIKDDWDAFVVESDEPEWSEESFWKNASSSIRDNVVIAFQQIKEEGRKLGESLIAFFMKPFNMLKEMSGGGGASGGGGFSIIGGVTDRVASMVADDVVMGPVGYSRVLSGPEGSFALNDKDTIVAGTNLGGGGGSTFNINVNANGITDRTDKRQLAREIGNMIQQEMSRSIGGTTMRGRYG